MTELKLGRKAIALEGQHAFKVGSVLVFKGMNYDSYEEVAYVFKDDHNEIQELFECEFKWVEEAE